MAPVSAEVLAEARVGGASAEQLAILAKGAVPSQEDYQAAVNRSVACIKAAGISTIPPLWATQRGITFEQIGVGVSSDGRTDKQTADVVQGCIRENSWWVERAWKDQPWADAAERERVEALRSALVVCLERGGNVTDPEWSMVELLQYSEAAAREFGAIDEGKYVDCAAEVGA